MRLIQIAALQPGSRYADRDSGAFQDAGEHRIFLAYKSGEPIGDFLARLA
jgi:hypothetical protein